MKVIFLDHDGVICLSGQWGSRRSNKAKKRGDLFDRFCPKAINVLNNILKETDAEIVVTSTWRVHCDLEYMQKLYIERGITKAPIGFTKDLENVWDDNDWFNSYSDSEKLQSAIRSKEIMVWLKENPGATSWIAIDDLPLPRLKNFFMVNEDEGIKKIGTAKSIIKILNSQQEAVNN